MNTEEVEEVRCENCDELEQECDCETCEECGELIEDCSCGEEDDDE